MASVSAYFKIAYQVCAAIVHYWDISLNPWMLAHHRSRTYDNGTGVLACIV